MYKRTIVLLLALGACSEQPAQQPRQAAVPTPVAPVPVAQTPAVTPMAPVQQAAMIDVPKDPAQLRRLETMGYTIHTDHLHAPGVSVCPKMGDDPIM